MATQQDNSLGIANEATYGTYVAPTRFYELLGDESLQFNKTVVQGEGLRVGSRFDRAGRRAVPIADAGGDFTVEASSKGLGLLLQACLGSGTSSLVSSATYQQSFIHGDAPAPLTVQKGLVQAGGTVDAYSLTGGLVSGWELGFPNAGIVTLKTSIDARDVTTSQTYAAPSYPSEPVNLFHFAGASLSTGTFTPATATTLPSCATPTVNVRSATVTANYNLTSDRFNFGGAGRKSKSLRGKPVVTGTMEIEYDSTTYRDLVLSDGSLSLVLTVTAGALGVGLETLAVALPAIKFDNPLPQANGSDLIVQSMNFSALDNLTNPPVGVYLRTADTVL